MRFYTHHGQAQAVPDFTNLTIEEAAQITEEKNFRQEIFDSLYVVGELPGTIIDQHPKPGKAVKKDRKIFFTINAQSPEQLQMPNLIGVSLREARARLLSYGLTIGQLSYRYDMAKNVVLEQKYKGEPIEPGDSITKFSEIQLVLGKGLGNEKKIVPDLIGLTIDEAREIASNALFSIGAVVEDPEMKNAPDTIVPRIFRQKPESNPAYKIPVGSTISIFISCDSAKFPQPEVIPEEELVWPELKN